MSIYNPQKPKRSLLGRNGHARMPRKAIDALPMPPSFEEKRQARNRRRNLRRKAEKVR